MPRPLKHRTELRQIRDALAEAEGCPVTQEILAQRLQTSKSYINAIEAGTKQMTAKFAHRLLQTFGVICAHPSLQPPPEIGPYEERTPFAPRDRTNLANGIRLHLRRPKSDGREIFEHYTMRRLRAIVDAAAERDLGPEVSAELLTALNKLIRGFKLEREYKIALLKRQSEWPPLPPDNPNTRVQLRDLISPLYAPDDHFPLKPAEARRPSTRLPPKPRATGQRKQPRRSKA